VTGSTLPTRASAFASDNAWFQSVASNTQQALNQLPSTASAPQVAQQVQPLEAAANMFQGKILNLQWSAAAKPAVQSLLERLGQVTAVLYQATRATGYTSLSQFKSQLKSAVAAAKSASSPVSAAG
jgi:predicted Zn-dependent protease